MNKFIYIICLSGIVLFNSNSLIASPIYADSINVPIDHNNPNFGTISLYYEFGAKFDENKPSIFIITDGQQFSVRRGRVKSIQDRIFGKDFNVIGIPGRIKSGELVDNTKEKGKINWELAYTYFCAPQWCADIDCIRKKLLGPKGKVMLYGGSGGAYLIHEYLTLYGENVSRAFVSGAINPAIDAKNHYVFDTYYQDLLFSGPNYLKKLHKVLDIFKDEREKLIMALSRQHYFYKSDELNKSRADLLDSLSSGNWKYLEKIKEDYQVNAVYDLLNSDEGVAIKVREYELVQPYMQMIDLFGEIVYPTLEMEYYISQELIHLNEQGNIPSPNIQFTNLKNIETEVFQLVAKHDKAAGSLNHIELADLYKNDLLCIVNDDHVFKTLRNANLFYSTVKIFFKHGKDSDEMKSQLEEIKRKVN